MTFGQSLDLAAEPNREIVELDLRTVTFRPASDGRFASNLERVPDALRPMLAAAQKGLVCFDEMILAQHDRVRLSAVVERVQGGRGGYRTTGAPRFVVRSDLGEATIEEIVETPDW